MRAIDPRVRIAFNPEFTREAIAVYDFLAPDRIVIGVDGHDAAAPVTALAEDLRRLYAPLEAPILVTDLTCAETIKIASNVFLAAKITFANELARLCAATGADVRPVVDGMGLDKRIGRSFLSPGPGFGGSCFPSQARALPELARGSACRRRCMGAITPSNARRPTGSSTAWSRPPAARVAGMRVALLGLTFKAGTDDLRESPALRLGRLLLAKGAHVAVFDPVALAKGVAQLRDAATTAMRSRLPRACRMPSRAAAAVVVATEWPEFAALDWAALAPSMAGDVIVDGRRIVDAAVATAAGLRVVCAGRGGRRHAAANGRLTRPCTPS